MESRLKMISLFTGAGGLDLGLYAAGYETVVAVERDPDAVATLHSNWYLPIIDRDIQKVRPIDILKIADLKEGEAHLLAGGPPCQPFSKSAYWKNGDSGRLGDPRAKTLGDYLRIVRTVLPEVVLLENVCGLVYQNKDEGMQFLEKGINRINRSQGTSYKPQVFHVNAAEYGVPQIRKRVFLIAHRDGLHLDLPPPTHLDVHLDQATKGVQPFRTSWDAIADLDVNKNSPDLQLSGKYATLLPSIPEGQNYLWHTDRGGGQPLFGWRTRYWSFLLKLSKKRPAWTIQANPGPSTGPFHWRNRRLSVRELCRLQTFPDDYEIVGSYASAHRQVGNAVPPAIGELVGKAIRRSFFGSTPRHKLSFIPEARTDCPRAHRISPVPDTFRTAKGKHKAHPGVGKGPGAIRRKALNTK